MLSAIYRKTKALYSCADFVRQPTARNSFEIAEGLRDSKDLRRAVARLREDRAIDAFFRERYLRGFPDVERLIALPPGSLGHEFAKTMKALNFSYDVFPPVQVRDDVTYYLMRGRETHDVWHLVTGFGTDVPGELGLQAFQLAQVGVPISKVLVALGILRTALFPEMLEPVLDAIARGWHLGQTARPFIIQRWEEGWDRPVASWRQELDIAA
jgi:ubiquinone biosynthesis protein COQ4